MPDEPVNPAGTPAPAAPPAAASPITPPVTPPAPPPQGDPAWLPDRIAQAKRSERADLLKSLGFATEEEAKAAGDAARKAADANKTAEQRAADATAQATAEKARADGALALIADEAKTGLASLTEAQRNLVVATAGDDPAKQLQAIRHVRAAMPGGAATQPVPPGAATSAAGGAPPPASTVPPNKTATLESLDKSNPMAAASYALRNARDLYPTPTQ